MNDLCSIELLRDAVARGLSADEEAALHAHLEHCEACCAQMEQLAGGEAWQQEAAALLEVWKRGQYSIVRSTGDRRANRTHFGSQIGA